MSHGLDTNGQNARYVKASEKHGTDRAVLRAMALGNADPAGVVARYVLAAEKYEGLEIREAHRQRAYFDFPTDIVWTRQNTREVHKLAEEADVIHLNNSPRAYTLLRLYKPALLHHHGSLFRKDPDFMLRVAREHHMAQAVSTIDLQKPAPELLPWLPTAYDIDALEAFGRAHRREDDGLVRVFSSPTNQALKATAELRRAVAQLKSEGLPVELVIVEGMTNAYCMAEKAKADIVFDQVMFGYGCNAVEAWGMGIPVVAGAEDPWVLARMRSEWGALPFYEATKDTIADALRALVLSPDLRAEWAAKGMAHVRRYHDERPALARLAELYRAAIDRFIPKPEVEDCSDAVVFVNESSYPVKVDGVPVVWTNGMARVSNPYAIERLRYFATRRNVGIREIVA